MRIPGGIDPRPEMKEHDSEEQILGILRGADQGKALPDLLRQLGILTLLEEPSPTFPVHTETKIGHVTDDLSLTFEWSDVSDSGPGDRSGLRLTSSRSKRLAPLWPGFPSSRSACAGGPSDGFAVRRPG